MAAKIGLGSEDADLVNLLLDHLEQEQLDFTLSFRNLGSQSFGDFTPAWEKRLEERGLNLETVLGDLKKVNPLFIPRNHQVEKAIQGANVNDLTVFHALNEVLKNPFEDQPDKAEFSLEPKPEEVVCATFCGT